MIQELSQFWNKTDQNRVTLIFNLYRVSLVTVFILSDFFHWQGVRINESLEPFFLGSSALYILFTLFAVYWAFRASRLKVIMIVQALVDMAYLLLLTQSFWGIGVLFPVFMNLSILGNGIVLPPSMIFPYVLSVVGVTLGYYHYFGLAEYFSSLELSFWIASFLLTAIAIRLVVKRLKYTQHLANQRGLNLFNLEKMSEHVINHFEGGVILIDAEDNIQLMNHAAKRNLGLDKEQTVVCLDVLPDKVRQHFLKWKQQGDPNTIDDESVCPLFNGLRLKFYSIGQKNYPATALFLEDTSFTIEKAQSMKLASLGRFTASIAHELRNPLGAVSHAIQLLAEVKTFSENEQRLIHIITNQSDRMNQIIKNVLQLSRRTPALQSKIELNHFLKEFVEKFKQTCVEDIEFVLESQLREATVNFDPIQLQQVLTNLCENSMKHVKGYADHPIITLKLMKNQYGTDVILSIIDNGPGFDVSQYPHLFEPFYTTDRQGGTGLGLYLCKEMCEANRAIIRADHPQQLGACFKIQFRETLNVSS